MNRRLRVFRRDLDRRVLARRGGAADHERQRDPAALHLARHPDHLVERRSDQTGDTDQACAFFDCGVRI